MHPNLEHPFDQAFKPFAYAKMVFSRLNPSSIAIVALALLSGLMSAFTHAQTQPTIAPSSKPSQGTVQFIYRSKQGDSAESIAFEFLKEAHKKQSREAFYALNRVASKVARMPVRANQPFNIPVAWMYDKPVLAAVVTIAGRAQMSHANTKDVLINVSPVDKAVEEGTTIKTGENSFVSLRFPDNSVLSVTPNSEVLIETLRQYAGSDVFKIKILLNKGRTESEVKSLLSQASEYTVRSRRLTTAVRGTQFNVTDDPSANASAEVLEGGVQLTDKSDKSLTVPVGFGSFVTAEKASDLIPLLPAPAWGCDTETVSISKQLPLIFSKKPAKYRLDVFSATLGRQQLLKDSPQLPSNLPVGDYSVSARGVDANGLQGYDATGKVSVKEVITPSFIQWVTRDNALTWVQEEIPAKISKIYLCQPS